MLEGSCLCGAVHYQVNAEAGPIIHCHCQPCRKAHASAFSSLMPVSREAFEWISGEELLTAFQSSPGKYRHFCKVCGSQLLAEREHQPTVMIRLGCLDTPITARPLAHIWRSDCADWYDPGLDLPSFPEGIPPQ